MVYTGLMIIVKDKRVENLVEGQFGKHSGFTISGPPTW